MPINWKARRKTQHTAPKPVTSLYSVYRVTCSWCGTHKAAYTMTPRLGDGCLRGSASTE